VVWLTIRLAATNMLGIDTDIEPEIVAPRLDGHDDLLQRAIACTLAQAIDRALHLPRPANLHTGQ
jgi:HEAT repeat protein